MSPSRKVIGVTALALLALSILSFWLWLRSVANTPLAAPLSLPTQALPTQALPSQALPSQENAEIGQEELLPADQTIVGFEKDETSKPVCGDVQTKTALVVGIDYRGEDYLYGLSDVVRIVQIDFVDPHINVVALPRDLLTTIPNEEFDVEGPIKLAQAYLFGTPGLDHYSGQADGAGALASVIQHNFGIRAENYLVINFKAFTDFIDGIGGIEVDLEIPVYGNGGFFLPAGQQTINGKQALLFARTRYGYGEPFRIDSQSLIMRGVFSRIKEPSVLLGLPKILSDFRSSVLTDFSPQQIVDGLCFITHLGMENILFFNPGDEVLEQGWEYLPSLNGYSWIWQWDENFLNWLQLSLFSRSEGRETP